MSVAIRFAVLVAIVGLCGGVLGYSIVQEASKDSAAVDPEVQRRNNEARRDRVARQVAAGEVRLVDAAAHLKHLGLVSCCQLEPDSNQPFEERLCRHVIQLAVATAKDSSAAEAVQQKLEKELADARDADGRIVLSSPQASLDSLAMTIEAPAINVID